MYKVMKIFLCTCCKNQLIGTGRTSADFVVKANLELVDKFCYLGDVFSIDIDANAAVETRIQIGWNKFRQLVPVLTNKNISLIEREIVQQLCVK